MGRHPASIDLPAVRTRLAAGEALAAISADVGISEVTIRKRLKAEVGVLPSELKPELNPERDAEWLDLIAVGTSFSDIAAMFDISTQAVSAWAKRRGIEAPKQVRERTVDYREVASIYAAALWNGENGLQAVAEEMGVRSVTAKGRIHRAKQYGYLQDVA